MRRILWIGFLFVLLTLSTGLGYYYAITKNVSICENRLIFNEKSVLLYDCNRRPVHDYDSNGFSQTTKITEIPRIVKQAFIDVEDKKFYQHNGFDYKRMIGASLKNLKTHSFKEGASTISQQLIKNTHLTQEKTLKRKLQELKLTKALEKKYSKEEILERYLNTIYFGHRCFGITSAAKFYFQKSPSELTLAEGSILAGLVKSPNNYSPFSHPENCKRRQEIVLTAMLRNNSITETEKREALKQNLPTPLPTLTSDYPHFVFEELSEIAEQNYFTIGGKIEIFTYLDQAIQDKVQRIAGTVTDCDKNIFVLDNATLGFKACASSVGNIKRLPGSLIKPLLVYAPALEENILSPATPLLDEKVCYGTYSPENYDDAYRGYVSARECVAKSLNVPAVKVLESLGIQKGAKYTEKMRLPIEKEDHSLALALGGMKKGFSLQDLTSAYATFANDGIYQKGSFISTIKINGQTVFQRKTKKEKVFSQDSAYLMTDMLKSAAQNGTAKKLRSLPFPIAAKTGTVGTEKGNTDAYALSYTTKDCIAVWLGNADNKKISYTGGGLPCNLLFEINEILYSDYKSKNISINDFKRPNSISCVSLDKIAYTTQHRLLLADECTPDIYKVSDIFKKSQIPLEKSTAFSQPTIQIPQIELQGNYVKITFSKNTPSYYQFKILRTDHTTHDTTILYEGNKIEYFDDNTLSPNNAYSYTIIPIFEKKEGKPIVLPTISTSPLFDSNDENILGKEWWNY